MAARVVGVAAQDCGRVFGKRGGQARLVGKAASSAQRSQITAGLNAEGKSSGCYLAVFLCKLKLCP